MGRRENKCLIPLTAAATLTGKRGQLRCQVRRRLREKSPPCSVCPFLSAPLYLLFPGPPSLSRIFSFLYTTPFSSPPLPPTQSLQPFLLGFVFLLMLYCFYVSFRVLFLFDLLLKIFFPCFIPCAL